MKENKTKPDIRFKGFTDDWEQRKLRDEAIEILAGGDINKEKTVENGKYPIYANALTNDGIVGYYDDYYRVTAPAVTVTGRGEVGYAKARMTHFTPVVRLLAVCSNHDCYFLENAINNHKVVVESTGVPQLTVPQLSSYNIFFPANGKEEVRIGKYFHTLDNLITLHQRECNQLKELKKTMLKKMFPRDGSNIPEVRFAGFTDDWEQRKFKKIFSVSQGLQIPVAERYTEPGVNRYFYITNEFLKENCTEEYYIESPSGNVLCDEEDILMTRTGNTGIVVTGVSGCFHNNFFKIKYDKNKFSKEYICYLLSSSHMQKIILNSAGSSTIPDLSHKSFYKIEGYFPNFKEEQEQIGTYFKQLDNLITLHQRELEILKNLKKTCLKRMFI